MSALWICDYCGEEIVEGGFWARVRVDGYGRDLDDGEVVSLNDAHYYHSGRDGSCFRRAYDALLLAEEWGPTLETIPTISSQAVAARRRKHTRPGDAS